MNNYKKQMNKLVEEAYKECVKIVDENGVNVINGKKMVKGCRAVKIDNSKAACIYIAALGRDPIVVDVNYVGIGKDKKLFVSDDGKKWHPLNDESSSHMVVAYPIPSDVLDVYENLYKQFYN